MLGRERRSPRREGRAARTARAIEHALSGAAVLLLGYCTHEIVATRLHNATELARLASLAEAAPGPERSRTRAALAHDGVIGRLELPRLGIEGIVEEGFDKKTLARSVGHLPGTALPGEPGNVVVAAHRDTLFRGLGEVRPGDIVRFVTLDGRFEYAVAEARVVEPWRTEVLAQRDREELTLITCYPFRFIGPAPSRFVVRAQRRGP